MRSRVDSPGRVGRLRRVGCSDVSWRGSRELRWGEWCSEGERLTVRAGAESACRPLSAQLTRAGAPPKLSRSPSPGQARAHARTRAKPQLESRPKPSRSPNPDQARAQTGARAQTEPAGESRPSPSARLNQRRTPNPCPSPNRARAGSRPVPTAAWGSGQARTQLPRVSGVEWSTRQGSVSSVEGATRACRRGWLPE